MLVAVAELLGITILQVLAVLAAGALEGQLALTQAFLEPQTQEVGAVVVRPMAAHKIPEEVVALE
jgi:hypothetical protein